MREVVYLLAFIAALAAISQAVARTWTDDSGRFRIEADLVEVVDGQARLKKADGTTVSVPLERLSAADRRFVRDHLARQLARQRRAGDQPAAPAARSSGDGAAWTQWRGPNRDGISTETGLLTHWNGDGPDIVWQADGLGEGYASVAVAGGRVFTMGQRDGNEYLIALSADDGHELWAARVGRGDHSNGTPTVDGSLVFAIGLKGDLLCADVQSGREIWRKNFKRDFGGRMMSGWGFSESPLVDGDRLLCTPGSPRAMMAALDKRTGRPLWGASLPDGGRRGGDGAGYSSIVVSQAAGKRQYVQLVGRGVIGVDAKNGRLLWRYDRIANDTANVPTPLVRGDYVFCSTGYGDGGSALLKLSRRGGGVNVQEVYYRSAKQMQNHHGGMILLGDYIYMGHGHNNGFPLCVHMLTGREAWRPGRGPGRGSAAVAYADGHLYFRYEDATMALIEATPDSYQLKGTFRIASRHDKSWPHPVIAGGRLYLRDQHQLHCYDIAAQ